MANAFQLDELDGGIGLVTFDVPERRSTRWVARSCKSSRAWSPA